jgi:hypothetical protein
MPRGVHVAPVVPWLVPYLVIWGVAAVGVRILDLRSSCTGFCAIHAGFETYGLLLGAAILSILAAATEIFLNR